MTSNTSMSHLFQGYWPLKTSYSEAIVKSLYIPKCNSYKFNYSMPGLKPDHCQGSNLISVCWGPGAKELLSGLSGLDSLLYLNTVSPLKMACHGRYWWEWRKINGYKKMMYFHSSKISLMGRLLYFAQTGQPGGKYSLVSLPVLSLPLIMWARDGLVLSFSYTETKMDVSKTGIIISLISTLILIGVTKEDKSFHILWGSAK